MTVKEALETLLLLENKRKANVVPLNSLAVGIARAGSEDTIVKANFVKDLLGFDFGGVPHVLVFPAEDFVVEAEALIRLTDAPAHVSSMVR